MSTVRAAVLTAYGQPLEIREFPEPSELAPGEVLVRVELAGICGTDVHLWKGELPVPLPVILGHETVGRIEKAGDGVITDWRGAALAVGDRVCWASSISCGECYYCRVKGQATRCIKRKAYGISYCADEAPHLRGGYAQKILLRAGTAIFRIPDTVSTDAVIGSGCALPTAIHGLERASVALGDTVVIQGSGPVGLAALAMSIESGASVAIVVGGPSHRLETAKRFGAQIVFNSEDYSDRAFLRKGVIAETGGYGADVVIECVGHPAAVPEGLEYCRDGGKYLVLGQYANAGDVALNPHTITRKQLQIIGSWGFEPRHVHRALSILEQTEWKHQFARQITHRFPLDQADQALQTTKNWRSGKTAILPNT